MASFLLRLLYSFLSGSIFPQNGENLRGAELVDYLNSHQNFFRAELSPFSEDEMNARVMKEEFGKRLEVAPVVDETFTNYGIIPPSFDSREKWPNCPSIRAIYDQGRCGSCWAFCTAELISDRTCIAKNKHFVASVQDIINCCSDCGFGCRGGWPLKALWYWDISGVCTGGPSGSQRICKPYTSGNGVSGTCQTHCQKGYNASYALEKKSNRGCCAHGLPINVAAIQFEIMTNGPVSSTFDVYEDFFHYKAGVYVRTSSSYKGSHCVKTIGWGVTNGTPYWLVANSWGTHWGENGFFRIRRGTNEARFESNMAADFCLHA